MRYQDTHSKPTTQTQTQTHTDTHRLTQKHTDTHTLFLSLSLTQMQATTIVMEIEGFLERDTRTHIHNTHTNTHPRRRRQHYGVALVSRID